MGAAARPRDPRLGSSWRGPVCLAILALACVLLRVPALDRLALNPDESQYEATAAYLLSTGTSPFAVSYGGAFTLALYELFAWVFGPYPMFWVRVAVLLLCLVTAWLLYLVVRRETSHWAGLVAGLVFLHYNRYFEGFSANREWFSIPFLLLGVYLYSLSLRPQARRPGLCLFGAGLACGAALWFKLQAVYIVAAIPAVVALRAITERNPRRAWRPIASYAAGGGASLILHLLPFAIAGSLGRYVHDVASRRELYVVRNAAVIAGSWSERWSLYLRHFYWDRPFAGILLVSYAFALLCLVAAGWRMVTRRSLALPLTENRVVLSFVLLLLLSMVSVQSGLRFFDHYFLLMLVPVAALFAFTLQGLAAEPREARRVDILALGLLALLAAHEIVRWRPGTLHELLALWPASLVRIVYVLASLALLGFLLVRPLRHARVVALSILVLQAGMLVLWAQGAEKPSSLPWHRRGFPHLVRELRSRAEPGDRLFVWGWLPELYSLTRMEPASQLTNCMYVVNDYQAVPRPNLNRAMARTLMRDLKARQPRFIVDASRRSWTLAASEHPWIYRLDLYPDFELAGFLRAHYVPVGTFDGCVLYVRRSESSRAR